MGRALKARIHTEALRHNYQRVKESAPNSKILAMIKANGYGHGLIHVAETLKEADAFGVACIEEALKLRKEGHIKNRIVLMEGFFNAEELQDILQYQLEPVIHHRAQVLALIERMQRIESIERSEGSERTENIESEKLFLSQAFPLKIWIKIDTGMHRLGFSLEEFQSSYPLLKELPYVDIQGFITHFSSSDEVSNPKTEQQIRYFNQILNGMNIQGSRSLANSAGILAWPSSHGSHEDWVRPGIMLYGVSPFANRTGRDLGLMPAMSLSTSLIAIHHLKKGDQVGYGGIYTCEENMPIGVLAVGYADGYPRRAPFNTPILLNGRKVFLIGRVSMDMITVDLRSDAKAKVGDPVELWGRNLPVEEVASHVGTIGYELLTNLSPRVRVEID